jgi:hypothetical protein
MDYRKLVSLPISEGRTVELFRPLSTDVGLDPEGCFEITEEVLRTVFNQLYTQRVTLRGMIVKPNKVLPGLTCPKAGSGGPRCCWRRAI